MDEKKTLSKEQKRTSLFLGIALSALSLTNALFVLIRQDKLKNIMPLSIALCGIAAVFAVIALISIIRNYKKLSEKKRSVICLVLTLLFCGLEVWMCVFAVNDLKEKRNVENSAALFIKDKYGIDAAAEYYDSFSSVNNTKWTTVKMNTDGKDFTVELFTYNDVTRFADDYQIDEIKQAVFDEVNRVYPGGTLRDVEVCSYEFLVNGRVIEKYFDGTNLDEVMDGQRGGITVDFVDMEFDTEDPLFEKLNKWGVQPYFVSFDTAAHLDEFVAKEETGTVYERDEKYAKYAPYITDCVEYNYNKESKKGEIIRKSCNIRSVGEFDYLFRDISENEKGAAKIEQRFAKYSDTALGKPVTKVYKRENIGSSSFFIYYPLEKLNGATVENIEAAWISDSAGSNNAFGTQKAEIVGDYAVFVLPYYVEEFIIVDTSGTGGAGGVSRS